MLQRRFSGSRSPWAPNALLAAALLSGVVGCGGEKSNVVSVDGNVAYQGKPVPNSAVTFFPQNGQSVIAATSTSGSYSALLPPGEYRVTIDVGRSFPPGWKEGDREPPPPLALPAKYSSRLNTPLTASVTATPGESQTVDLKLN
jgi:hypothetical protein